MIDGSVSGGNADREQVSKEEDSNEFSEGLTEQMIINELEEMGVEITADVIHHIRRELENFLADEEQLDGYFASVSALDEEVFQSNVSRLNAAFVTEMEGFSGVQETPPSTYSHLIYRAQPLPEQEEVRALPPPLHMDTTTPQFLQRHREAFPSLLPRGDRLGPASNLEAIVQEGYIRLQSAYDYIHEMERKFDAEEGDDEDEPVFRSAHKARESIGGGTLSAHRRRMEFGRAARRKPGSEEKENQEQVGPSAKKNGKGAATKQGNAQKAGKIVEREAEEEEEEFEIGQDFEEDPRLVLKRYYKLHALRPVLNVEPGRLPYRADPVERMRQYREAWARDPPPHEKRRLSLRWRIRDMMLKKDWIRVCPPPKLKSCRRGDKEVEGV